MDEIERVAHVAQVRSALAGLLMLSRNGPDFSDADMVRVTFDIEGGIDVEFFSHGQHVGGMGA